jgi:hypothetical protein
VRLLVLLPALLSMLVFAEPRFPISPKAPVRPDLLRASGMIFTGVVLAVQRSDTTTSSAITQVTFRVENAIRGVRRGQLVRVSEWGGLWNSGERYTKGERVLLFLYPKSKLGLTSPVGGKAGRYAVDSAGRIVSTGQQGLPIALPLKDFISQVRRAPQE